VRIREATPDDWPEVAALLVELGRPDVRGTDEEDAARSVYEDYLQREDTRALVAEDDDGRVAGFIDMDLRPRLSFTTPQAWIPDLVVAEGARSRGMGAALLARAEEIAQDEGCWSMALESASWRTRAHAFYEREGWADVAHAFTRNLSDRPWPPEPPGEPGSGPR
jgi:GNAT superfamily N-acetyltransferase